MGDKCNYLMVSTFLSITLLGMRIDFFQSCGHFWIFQIFRYIEYNTLMASSFRIFNSSTEIPLHPLVLLIAMLPTAPLTFFYRMSGSEWLTTPSSSFCVHLDLFIQFFCVFFPSLPDLFSSTRSLPFMSFIVPIFVQKVPLIPPIFLKRSLVFPLRNGL